MSADIQNIEDDDGLKKQWGTQWIYKVQGAKKTLDTPKFMWASLVAFILGIVVLLFGGNEPAPSPIGGSNIPVAELRAADSNLQNVSTLNPSQLTAIKPRSKSKIVKKFLGPQLMERPHLQKIPPGIMVKAVLVTGASDGPVRAELTDNMTFNGEPLLEEGTILLGSGSSSEERLFVRFDQLVTKAGEVQPTRAEAIDSTDKIAGLKGSKVSGQAMRVAGSVGLGFIGGFSEGLQDSDSVGGVAVRRPSMKNAILNGAATAALDESRDMMSKVKDRVPRLEVAPGVPIFIIFENN